MNSGRIRKTLSQMMKLAQDCKFRVLIKTKIAAGYFVKKYGVWG